MSKPKSEIRLLTIELDVEVKTDYPNGYTTSIRGHPETVATSKHKEEAIDETLRFARELIYNAIHCL